MASNTSLATAIGWHDMTRMAYRMACLMAYMACAMTLMACGDDEAPEAAEPEPEAVEMGPCGHMGEPTLLLLRRLDFISVEDGVADGLDLDGHVSAAGDAVGCGKADFTAPDGTPGIDNQFARLMPAIQAVGGEGGFQSAISRAINTGAVLVTMRMDHLDDETDDSCVDVTVGRALGAPDIGNDGYIEAGQTFDRDPDAPSYTVEGAAVVDGVMQAGPFTLALPMVVDDIELLITVRDMYLRGGFDDDGTVRGIFAGSIVLDELNAFIDRIDEGSPLFAAMRSVLGANADLDPDADGRCRRISIAVGVEAVPAFYFTGPPTEAPSE